VTATATIIVPRPESRRSWLSTVAIIHHADPTALALALGSFALSVAAMYVGLPGAFRNPTPNPSPLDSLGALSLATGVARIFHRAA
jgi:hypothetical protein